MYRHADMTMSPMNRIGIFAHKSVTLLLCTECSEIQVATLSLT